MIRVLTRLESVPATIFCAISFGRCFQSLKSRKTPMRRWTKFRDESRREFTAKARRPQRIAKAEISDSSLLCVPSRSLLLCGKLFSRWRCDHSRRAGARCSRGYLSSRRSSVMASRMAKAELRRWASAASWSGSSSTAMSCWQQPTASFSQFRQRFNTAST